MVRHCVNCIRNYLLIQGDTINIKYQQHIKLDTSDVVIDCRSMTGGCQHLLYFMTEFLENGRLCLDNAFWNIALIETHDPCQHCGSLPL